MTVNRSPISLLFARGLMLMLLLTGITASSAFAQDEYKQTYNSALEAAKARNYTEAYTLFVRASSQARQAGDTDVADRSAKVAAQIDYNLGKNMVADNPEGALQRFEAGIKLFPGFADNYLGKALALNKLGRTDESLATFQELMESPDADVAAAAERALVENYIYLASTALARNGATPTRSDAQEAIGHLTKAQALADDNADVLYYFGEAYKAQGDYQQAISYADRALAAHNGSRADKAKIYFMKGEALMNAGDNNAAKQAFSEATYGSYRASAQHYIDTL